MTTWLCPGTGCTNLVNHADLCEDCTAHLGRMCLEIGGLWSRARVLMEKGSSASGDTTVSTGKAGSSPPLRIVVLDTVEHAWGVVTSWAATIAIRQSDEWGASSDMERSYRHAVSYLAGHYLTLQGTALLIDCYNAIYRIRKRLNTIAGDTPPTKRLHEPCPACHMMGLIMRHDDDYVVCLTCSSKWGQSAYLGLARVASMNDSLNRT